MPTRLNETQKGTRAGSRMPATAWRRLPVGAEVVAEGGVHFRVWCPRARRLELCLLRDFESCQERLEMAAEPGGYFSLHVPHAGAGQLYVFTRDGGDQWLPDPASRFQPHGPHGPSQVIDPRAFAWTDQSWRGISAQDVVIYEMHIGTFTPEGTWRAAIERFEPLAALGITVLEVMPIAEFPGRFGWGYDGVDLYAPTRLYGPPDDFRLFVDRAHALGMAVILDVVYNHLGPDGNYLKEFSLDYFSDRYRTDWGQPFNLDGENCGPVREFVASNAEYWIDEFHLDGLRLDATQDIHDASPDHILAEIARRVRRAAPDRPTWLVAENEPQRTRLVRPQDQGGYGLDMMWNDDFHHAAMVLLTGRREAYYTDYRGTPQEFISCAKHGFLYQGQWYSWQRQPRGTSTRGLPRWKMVHFIQNHDQIANTALGLRAHQWTSPGRFKAMTALLLLCPQTPMLFQGQEYGASTPFFYFADHRPDLAAKIAEGRKEFMAQFPSISRKEVQDNLPAPGEPTTFVRCKLNHAERSSNEPIYQLHRDLLAMRRNDPVFRHCVDVDGAVLGEHAFVLRFFSGGGDDRLLLINFDSDMDLRPMPEPLLAPPEGLQWEVAWSSEDLCYGGAGTPPLGDEEWLIPGQCALVLRPVPRSEADALARRYKVAELRRVSPQDGPAAIAMRLASLAVGGDHPPAGSDRPADHA